MVVCFFSMLCFSTRLRIFHYTAWHLGKTLAAPRLCTKPSREAAGLWWEWFSCGYPLFFVAILFLITMWNFNHAAWHLEGPLAAPRLSTKPPQEAAGRWREWFSKGYSLFFAVFSRSREFHHAAWHLGGPRQPPGSPQNRPGRRPSGGWSGFHVVIHAFSLPFVLNRNPELSSSSLAPCRAPGKPQAFHKTAPRGRRALAGVVFIWLLVVFRGYVCS